MVRNEPGVPDGALALAWARFVDPVVAPKPGLTVDRVVAAAVTVADAEGLAAVSMSRVAAELGFTTMALYRHVGGKPDLLVLMQDRAVGLPPPDLADLSAPAPAGPHPDAGDSRVRPGPVPRWRALLERHTWAALAVHRAHPWLPEAIGQAGIPATPHQLSWLENGLGALSGTPLREPEKLSAVLLISAHVFADLTFEASATAAGQAWDGDGGSGADGDYAATMTGLLDPERFPAVVAVMAAGALDDTGDRAVDRDTAFAFGLARILDGLQVLIEARAAG